MDVYFVPIDIKDKRKCCKCEAKATLMDLVSGRFFCPSCASIYEFIMKD